MRVIAALLRDLARTLKVDMWVQSCGTRTPQTRGCAGLLPTGFLRSLRQPAHGAPAAPTRTAPTVPPPALTSPWTLARRR